MKRVHSVNLGTDPFLANHNPAISSVLAGTGKVIKSTEADKSPDNSNVLHVFNNNTYTNFRNAHKHILIPSCIN